MRKTTLDDVLFPVELRPLFYDSGKIAIPPRAVQSHRAVVNKATNEPVGIVGAGYRLITNEEALRYGRQCCRQLFGLEDEKALQVFNVYAPPRGWYCQIDLIHKGFEVNIFKQDIYLPFVRVTNSYNTSRALRFDIGYCRKLCLNGVIFEQATVKFKFSHSGSVNRQIDFSPGKDQLEKIRKSFASTADKLFQYKVPKDSEMPLFFRALDLPQHVDPVTKPTEEKRNALVAALKEHVAAILDRYRNQLGDNVYAVFNAITEFASHPPELRDFRRTPHAMQTMAGKWAQGFAALVAKNGSFDLHKYLEAGLPA